jgi:hypothetical protein
MAGAAMSIAGDPPGRVAASPSAYRAARAVGLSLLAGAASAQTPLFEEGFESGGLVRWDSLTGVSEVRLLVVGDTGVGNPGQACVGEAMGAICLARGGCSAVLLAGDNFYDIGVESTSDPQWSSKFEQPYDVPGLALSFHPVFGNHDYDGAHLYRRAAQIAYSSLPVGSGPGTRPSSKWTMPSPWYQVTFGGGLVRVFAIDTHDMAGQPPDDQPPDLASAVSRATESWKLVMGHHPRFTSGAHQTDNEGLDDLYGLFDEQQAIYCEADLYIAGHDHDREVIAQGQDPDCPETGFLISGAGARTRVSPFAPVSHSLFYDDVALGFALLEITSAELAILVYDVDLGACDSPVLVYSGGIGH